MASTSPDSRNSFATSRALKTEFSAEEIVNAGPEKSHKEQIRQGIILPIKLVNWLISTALCRLSFNNSVSWLCCSSLREILLLRKLSCSCQATSMRPRNWWMPKSISIATITPILPPFFPSLAMLESCSASSSTFIMSNCCGNKGACCSGGILKYRWSKSNCSIKLPWIFSWNLGRPNFSTIELSFSIPCQRFSGKTDWRCLDW